MSFCSPSYPGTLGIFYVSFHYSQYIDFEPWIVILLSLWLLVGHCIPGPQVCVPGKKKVQVKAAIHLFILHVTTMYDPGEKCFAFALSTVDAG